MAPDEAPDVPDERHPLRATLESTAKSCTPNFTTGMFECPPSADALLARKTNQYPTEAVAIHAEALGDDDPSIVATAALSIQGMSVYWTGDVSAVSREDALALLERVPALPVEQQRAVVRFATEAAWHTAETEARAMHDALEDPISVARARSAALQHTRLAELSQLTELADGSAEVEVSKAVLYGIDDMAPLTPEEQSVVCPWATAQLDRNPAGDGGAPLFASASGVVSGCPDGMDTLLARTEAHQAELPLEYHQVLFWERSCEKVDGTLLDDRIRPEQCPRIRSLLEKTANDSRASEKVRGRALGGLAHSFRDDQTSALIDALASELPDAAKQARQTLER
jgi:hypothetical protein